MWNPMTSKLRKTNLIMDHIVPITALIFDYFLSNPIFIRRHIYAIVLIIFVYLPIYMYFIISGNPPYPNLDLYSVKNLFFNVLIGFSIAGLFLLIEICTKLKLEKCGMKN
jgi:hypothetical protein